MRQVSTSGCLLRCHVVSFEYFVSLIIRNNRLYINSVLHTPSSQPSPPRRRLARHPGAEVVEEIQTGSWLWGPGRFCQAPQCKPRRGGRGAPHTFASANGPPGPPRPRPGGHGGPIQRGPAKKKSRSKPLQPSHHHGTVRSPTVKKTPPPSSTHGLSLIHI